MTNCTVFCRDTDGRETKKVVSGFCHFSSEKMTPETPGFSPTGEMCLRVPVEKWADLKLGDRISRDGEVFYIISEIRKNIVENGGLSHYKVIGRR